MNSRVPTLSKTCVSKIVSDIRLFCRGTDFDDLGNHSTILGPLENLCKAASDV